MGRSSMSAFVGGGGESFWQIYTQLDPMWQYRLGGVVLAGSVLMAVPTGGASLYAGGTLLSMGAAAGAVNGYVQAQAMHSRAGDATSQELAWSMGLNSAGGALTPWNAVGELVGGTIGAAINDDGGDRWKHGYRPAALTTA
jgi:hypothetical protein